MIYTYIVKYNIISRNIIIAIITQIKAFYVRDRHLACLELPIDSSLESHLRYLATVFAKMTNQEEAMPYVHIVVKYYI